MYALFETEFNVRMVRADEKDSRHFSHLQNISHC